MTLCSVHPRTMPPRSSGVDFSLAVQAAVMLTLLGLTNCPARHTNDMMTPLSRYRVLHSCNVICSILPYKL